MELAQPAGVARRWVRCRQAGGRLVHLHPGGPADGRAKRVRGVRRVRAGRRLGDRRVQRRPQADRSRRRSRGGLRRGRGAGRSRAAGRLVAGRRDAVVRDRGCRYRRVRLDGSRVLRRTALAPGDLSLRPRDRARGAHAVNVRVTRFLDGARAATGHAVIVDVFRAFTTAAFCIAAGAREIVLVADHEQALALKRDDPSLFLTGEIGGRPIAGFDVGNSPSAIERLDLSGRRVVQRTSSGTQGVVAATSARRVLLGSFVAAGATVRYLRREADEVTIVAMGAAAQESSEEDERCASYLAASLTGSPLAGHDIVLRTPASEWPEWFPRRDAELALEIDRFDFALPVTREDGLLVARPVRSA
ncbi:MAG: 2-phosphosulfolactate phosphatase [Chloroflexi bacterium]|nr:MAG: 2-phosphosulfolactate phosphatase [Chloroflexota bacterium]